MDLILKATEATVLDTILLLIIVLRCTVRRMADDILEAIRRIVQRIAEIDAERQVLDAQLADIRRLVGATTAPPKKRSSKPWAAQRDRPLRQGTLVYYAEKVIRTKGEPVYIDTLVDHIRSLSGLNVQKSSLVSNLSRYVRSGVVFSRPGEGYYSLLEFDGPPKPLESSEIEALFKD